MPVVYWLKLKDYTDPLKQGYIGVSVNKDKRLSEHFNKLSSNKHENPVVQRYYNKYKSDIEVQILFEGSETDCYIKELSLRPVKHIGWNIAPGGNRPPATPGNLWNKGRKATDKQKQARSELWKEKGYKPPTREKCLWWNNGEYNTMSIIQPGAEWIRGRISFWWTNGKENKFATKAPGLSWNKGRVTPWLGKEK